MGKSSSDRGRSRSAPALPFAGPCDLDEVCVLLFGELARMRFIGAANEMSQMTRQSLANPRCAQVTNGAGGWRCAVALQPRLSPR